MPSFRWYIADGFWSLDMGVGELLKVIIFVVVLWLFDHASLKRDVIKRIGEAKPAVRWAVYVALSLVIIFFSQKGVAAEFVYFQF